MPAPPVFPDAELTERARVLDRVAWTTLLLVAVFMPLMAIAQPDALWRAVRVMAVVSATVAATLILNRRGRTRAASWLYVGSIIALLTYNALQTGGIHSPGVQAYFIFVMLAGLLLGRRAGVATALTCMALGLALVLGESAGLVGPDIVRYGTPGLWIITCLYIGVALITMRLATDQVGTALARAQAELAAHTVTGTDRDRLTRVLTERVKELRLLHEAGRLLQDASAVDRLLLGDLVALMPHAWLHDADARARITYRDITVSTPGWQPTPWIQAATFNTSDGRGTLELAYLHEHPDADEGPFLAEERSLINSLAEMLRSHIEHRATDKHRQALASQLRQAQKMDALGTLAGGIAHDFNNILTAIGGNAQLAAAEAPAGTSLAEGLNEILTAHERARDLVRRILLFSRREETERRVLAPGTIVDETLRLLRASLPPNITIASDVPADLPLTLADPTQLHQVFMNLGTNAAYAMKESGGTLTVGLDTVSVDETDIESELDVPPGEYVRIVVSDTGSGMSREVQERLFEPFFTTKGQAGTGLGLAVVHGIVRDHGGAITLSSEVGVGTRFEVFLPAYRGSAAVEPVTAERFARGAGQHIMYVDDEPSLAHVMARTFKYLGYRCTSFTDPDAALHEFRIAPHNFDAVVTDLQMPTMSGLDLVRAVRAIRKDTPVAVASGYAADKSQDRDAETVEWIHKPSSLEELAIAAQKLTGRHHTTEAR